MSFVVSFIAVLLSAFVFAYNRRKDALELWGVTTSRTYRAASATGFLAFRDAQHGTQIWSHLRVFALAADGRQLVEQTS